MRVSHTILLAAFVVFLAPVEAQEKSEVEAEAIAVLIGQLGHDDYSLREAAGERLAALGTAATQAVQGATTHPNREIRYRSQRLLGVIREREAERRLLLFLEKKESPADPPLASWSRFRDRYGDSEHGRKLFVMMQRTNAELLRALEASPRAAAESLVQQVARDHQGLQFGGQNLAPGEIAATLFVAAEPDIALPSQTFDALFSHCYQPSFSETLTSGEFTPLARRILGRVVLRSEDRSAIQAMHVAGRFNLPEGIAAAKRVLERQEGVEATSMTQFALMTIAQLGDSSHLPLVERFLQDQNELSRMQENTTTYIVKLCDVALATAVILTKQDLKTYFAVPAQYPSDLQPIFFDPRIVGFTNDAQRAAVFARWARYKADHPGGN